MSRPPIFTVPTVSTAWPTVWVDLLALKVTVPTTHICSVHCVSWPFCTNTYCIHCVLHPLHDPLRELTFLHQHLLHPLCTASTAWPTAWVDLFASTPTASTVYCVHCVGWPFCTNTYCVHCMGWPFTLKVMVPTTHICSVHCVSLPFCTNTYCIHCVHCYPTCPTLLTFLHLQSVPLTRQCYS